MDVVWKKSRRCESNGCVEVAEVGDEVVLRNSLDPEGEVATFSMNEWTEFMAGAREGDFIFQ